MSDSTDTSKIQLAGSSSGGGDEKSEALRTEFGMSENLLKLIETPEEMMERVLMKDEEVRSTFDCFFPTQFIPQWKIMLLIFATGGLYLIVLAYRYVQQWCYKNKCCTPSQVAFKKGKMAVTSKGRIICWDENVDQVKVDRSCICAARILPPRK